MIQRLTYKTIQPLTRTLCWIKGHRWLYDNIPTTGRYPIARSCDRCQKREGYERPRRYHASEGY